MASVEENDCILVQTDFTFNIALTIFKSLKADNVFHVCTSNVVTIENIASNDQDDDYSLRFGGGGNLSSSLQKFARTASSVLRMMMLKSVNATSSWYPKIGEHSGRRNRQKMDCNPCVVRPDYRDFVIAPSKAATVEIYSYYDSLHPHFKIERELSSVQPDEWWSMQNMMLIFRRNFTEIIEIGTSLQARHQPNTPSGPGTFHSNAHVRCIVRCVSNPEHDGLKFLRILKNTSGYQHECMKLAELLHLIAQRLPIQQKESDDDEDKKVVPLPPHVLGNQSMSAGHLHGNYQLVAPAPVWGNQQAPAQMQQPYATQTPVQMQGNHQRHAAQALAQMQVNQQPYAAQTLAQMQGNHWPSAAQAPAPAQMQQPYAAQTPAKMQGNHQPFAVQAPVQMQVNQQPYGSQAPAAQVQQPYATQMQGNHAALAQAQMQQLMKQVATLNI